MRKPSGAPIKITSERDLTGSTTFSILIPIQCLAAFSNRIPFPNRVADNPNANDGNANAHLHLLRVQINSLHGSLREQRRLLKTRNIYDGNIYDRNANDENTNDENANDRNANDGNANDGNANDVSTIG
jgi:hypothetical protein